MNQNNDDDGSNSGERSLNLDSGNKFKKSNDSDYVDENFDIDDDQVPTNHNMNCLDLKKNMNDIRKIDLRCEELKNEIN